MRPTRLGTVKGKILTLCAKGDLNYEGPKTRKGNFDRVCKCSAPVGRPNKTLKKEKGKTEAALNKERNKTDLRGLKCVWAALSPAREDWYVYARESLCVCVEYERLCES